MPRGQLGKLPSLQAIGKAQSVDLDDPPDALENDGDSDYRHGFDLDDFGQVYIFEGVHANVSAQLLKQAFSVVQPGGHICKRRPDTAASFLHCKLAVRYGRKYGQLRQLLETRARLQLVRDYTSRLNAAAMFVKDLEGVVMDEYRTWYNICHNCLQGSPTSKLECLSSVCEDLRIHMNHWNSLKQLIHTDQWLQPLLPNLCLETDSVRRKLYHLRDNAIWWIDRLIRIGLQVLAHTDLERLDQDALWGITRGIEDFNNIVSAIRYEKAHESLSVSPSLAHGKRYPLGTFCDAVIMNSYKNIGESIKPIPFMRVLHLLASERSKYVAVMTHRILTTSDSFMHIVFNNKLNFYNWSDFGVERTKHNGATTSDYYSGTGSHTSLSTGPVAVRSAGGPLTIPSAMTQGQSSSNAINSTPDLTRQVSSVVGFASREQDFAAKFLQIVCHSTNLLKKPGLQGSRKGTLVPGELRQNGSRSDLLSEDSAPGTLTLKSEKRKTVSWGDAADNSVRGQLTQKYLDLLWQFFASHLFEFFHEPIWGGPDAVKGELGHIGLMSDALVMLIIRMVQQLCARDVLPAGAIHAVASVSRRLHVTTAWNSWQAIFCLALASSIQDRCAPTPLADGEFSTKTGRLLRDAYQPLLSVLRLLDMQANDASRGANGMVQPLRTPQLSLLLPTLQRFLITCDAGVRWCQEKSQLFISSWMLSSFFLVAQSDLKIMGDEMKKALILCQRVVNVDQQCSNQVETQMYMQLHHYWNQLNDYSGQLQTLAGNIVKQFSEKCKTMSREFFDDAMPVGKVWKKKTNLEFPTEPNSYVCNGMIQLVEPVVVGVSKLKLPAQLSVISIAVVSMCEAWTEFILSQKIRFSLHGAYQLQHDFGFVRTWLETHIQNPDVRQSILSLEVFKYLHGAVELLKRQPRGRSRSRTPANRKAYVQKDDANNTSKFACLCSSVGDHPENYLMIVNGKPWKGSPRSPTPGGSSEDAACSSEHPSPPHNGNQLSLPSGENSVDYNSGMDGMQTLQVNDNNMLDGGATGPGGMEMNHTGGGGASRNSPPPVDMRDFRMTNMEQWLALRVHGGARSWPRFPSCFTTGDA